jgi:hypothetical protein
MRRAVAVAALLLVFAVTARSVWLKSRALATAYEVRALREAAADFENRNDLLCADVAARSSLSDLERAASDLGLVALEPHAGLMVRARPRGLTWPRAKE